MKHFRSNHLLRLSMFLLTVITATSAALAHSNNDSVQQQKQVLTKLYTKASAEKALWKGVPELYQQALTALDNDDQEKFKQLYPLLHFKLSKGLEQAESQLPEPSIPTYLK